MTATMNHVYVVLDSMTVMHYTWFADYPWQDHPEFNGKKVIIVFVRPMIEELDKHKDTHKRGNVRKRCRNTLGWIEENLGGKMGAEVEVKAGLFARADFKQYTRHRAVRTDDRILEFAKERDVSVTICSGDYTLRLMAQENGLKAVTPLEAQRITDEEETELQEAQKELDVFKNRLPKLSISSKDRQIQYAKASLPFASDTFLHERIIELTEGLHPSEMLHRTSAFPFLEVRPAMFSSMHEYDPGEVKHYQERLQRILRESLVLAERVCASPLVKLNISNVGTSPATMVEVLITVPEGFTVTDLDELTFPKLPKRPRRRLDIGHFVYPPRHLNHPRPEPNVTFITRENLGVWRAKVMSHHKTLRVPPFLILRDVEATLDEFGLEVAVVASELPRRDVLNIPIKLAEPSDIDEERVKWIAEKLLSHFESPSEASKRMDAEDED